MTAPQRFLIRPGRGQPGRVLRTVGKCHEWRNAMTERTEEGQGTRTSQRTEVRAVEVMVVAVLVPAAFVAGWRARGGWAHLLGYR